MKTLEECVQIAYKSMALTWGSSRNKWNIVKALKDDAYTKQMSYPVNSDDYLRWEAIKRRWADLSTRISWEWHFYKGSYAGFGNGVHSTLQDIWEFLGNDRADLNYFDDYDNLRILSPMTFIEEPPTEIIALENDFVPDDDVLRVIPTNQTEFEALYKLIFNHTVRDIYMGIGMGIWADGELDRTTATGTDPDLSLATWDMVVEGARNFLYHGRNCLAEVEIESRAYFEGSEIDLKSRHITRSKYIKNNESAMSAVGGIYKINYDKLPVEWQAKVDVSPVEY